MLFPQELESGRRRRHLCPAQRRYPRNDVVPVLFQPVHLRLWQLHHSQVYTSSNLYFRFCVPKAAFIFSSKCDTNIDCEDKSDEINCAYMKLPDNYAKELIPRDPLGGAVLVHMNVSFLAFPVIDVFSLKFTVDYFLNMRWFDLRIDFRDLNNVTILNSLDPEGQCQKYLM